MFDCRRYFLLTLLLFAGAFACSKSGSVSAEETASGAHNAALASGNSESLESQLDYVEVITGGVGPEARLPMIIAIHGLGDSPEGFASLMKGFKEPARVILPRGPEAYHNGYSWFPIRGANWDDGAWVDELSRSASRIASLIKTLNRRRPTKGKALVMGFSQGGMLTFTLAAHHPEVVGLALPIGGFLPKSLTPDKGSVSSMPRMLAFNGEADTIIPFRLALDTLKRLKPLGADMKLNGFPKVAHRIPPPMRASIYAEVEAYLDSLEEVNAP